MIRVTLTLADGEPIRMYYQLRGGEVLSSFEVAVGDDPIVRLPFHTHGEARLHTICGLDDPDIVRPVEW